MKINLLLQRHGNNKVVLYNIKKLNNKFIDILIDTKQKGGNDTMEKATEDIKGVTSDLKEYTAILKNIKKRLQSIKEAGENSNIQDIISQIDKILEILKKLEDY